MELHEILSRVDMSGGEAACWPYRGARLKPPNSPYGVAPFGRHSNGKWKMWRVHRLLFVLAHGPISDDTLVCHRCDNPPCCNWLAHLFSGTNADNQRDSALKGRRSHVARMMPRGDEHWARRRPDLVKRGEDAPSVKLTAEQVEAIRAVSDYWGINTALAKQYGVSPVHIGRIRRGVAWHG